MPSRRLTPLRGRRDLRHLLVLLPIGLIVAVCTIDVLSPPHIHLGPLLVAAPAITAAFAGPRLTVAIGALAVAAQVFIGVARHTLATENLEAQIAALVVVSALVVLFTVIRGRDERRLIKSRSVAAVAQQVLLRPLPERSGPLEIASLYLPAEEEAEMGGDLFAAARTLTSTRLIIGDVRGKGLPAYGHAALLLGAFRAAAHRQATLPHLARHLDGAVRWDSSQWSTLPTSGPQGAERTAGSQGAARPVTPEGAARTSGPEGEERVAGPPGQVRAVGTEGVRQATGPGVVRAVGPEGVEQATGPGVVRAVGPEGVERATGPEGAVRAAGSQGAARTPGPEGAEPAVALRGGEQAAPAPPPVPAPTPASTAVPEPAVRPIPDFPPADTPDPARGRPLPDSHPGSSSDPGPTPAPRRLPPDSHRGPGPDSRPAPDPGLSPDPTALDPEETFATVALLDIPDRAPVLRAITCGHPPALLLRDGTARTLHPERPALPIGLGGLPGAPAYEVETFPFEPGDLLLLYTDGVTEARDAQGAFYPLAERAGAWSGCSPHQLLRQLRADLLAHTRGKLGDDAAAVAVRRLPTPPSATP
ncbi:SpoIIE family protein phosphatase [Streptomyces sp. NPDC021749]|uniref:SpoIIE family protein phosphatase n=1 Tax=Streptomyces sp. NPDC021749 TaxID=3154905 RepID=UPI00340D13EF